MKKVVESATSKFFFIGIFVIIILLSVLTVYPIISSLVLGAIIAFVFYPVYNLLQKLLKRKRLAAFILALLLVLAVTIPAFFFLKAATSEVRFFYINAKQQISQGRVIGQHCYDDNIICDFVNGINTVLKDENTRAYMEGVFNRVVTFLTERISDFIISIPQILLNIFIMLFTAYYLFKDGPALVKRISRAVPLKVHHQDAIVKQFGDVIYAVVWGTLVVALIQGALAAFGYWLFGIKSYILWGTITAFFALVPFLGTAIVWVPASLYLMLMGYLNGETKVMLGGVGLFFFGLLIVSTIDNFIKPVLVAGRAHVHPVLVLAGVIGGLMVFGVVGFVVGPLILAFLQLLFEIYEREKIPHLAEPEPCILGRTNKLHKK